MLKKKKRLTNFNQLGRCLSITSRRLTLVIYGVNIQTSMANHSLAHVTLLSNAYCEHLLFICDLRETRDRKPNSKYNVIQK